MKLFQKFFLTSGVAFLFGMFTSPRAEAYIYCGYHDRNFPMTAYHFNSEFWVDMLVNEANKWNAVHPVLSIGRTRSRTVPSFPNDGRNVIGWIGEADLMRLYNLSWSNVVGWTILRRSGDCGRVTEADVLFNPGISLFTPQTQVPYNLGYQEIALHELGHVLTHHLTQHENRTLAVMTDNNAVSNVLYTSDKVGWLRSADFRFDITDRRDMGVFPLRNAPGSKIYSTLTVSVGGDSVTIRDFTVQNLSSSLTTENPVFKVFLENTGTGTSTEIGQFSWGSFPAYNEWSGNLTFSRPDGISAGTYRVVAVYQGSDSDSSNNRAIFGSITLR